MSINIQGIAVDSKDIDDISKRLFFNPVSQLGKSELAEISFNSIGDDELYIIESKKGAIIIVGDNIPLWEIGEREKDNFNFWKIPLKLLSQKNKVLRFMIGETSGIFAYQYYENGNRLRFFNTSEGEIIVDSGDILDVESQDSEPDENIYQLIFQITGSDLTTLSSNQDILIYKYLGMNGMSEILANPDIQYRKWYIIYKKFKSYIKLMFQNKASK